MSMFGPKMGTWYIHSKSDKRWRASGRAKGLVCEGGPPELIKKFKKLEKKYGTPPKDCEYGFMKD